MHATRQLPALFEPNGFLADTDSWNEGLARAIAENLGIGTLTDAHWAVVGYLRCHYLNEGTLPWEAHVCRALGLDKGCIHSLFGGPFTAWLVAGLPNPGEEARTYMLNLESGMNGH